jgi:DNA-binding NarL/FixJ family response regulator
LSRGIRTLIADDDPDIRELLHLSLDRDPRFTVIGEAENGEVAVSHATELAPDLILLDLAMPVMDGLEALPLIRSAQPAVKVAVLTGFVSNRLADQAHALGADIYLEKGASIASLPNKLEELVGELPV